MALRLSWWLFALLGVSALLPLGTRAQDRATTEGRDARARTLYEAGEAAFNVGHYESAMELFLEAYSMSNRSALLYNLGHTADRLRRDDDSIRYFERFLAEAPENAPNRDAATQRLAALRQAQNERQTEEQARALAEATRQREEQARISAAQEVAHEREAASEQEAAAREAQVHSLEAQRAEERAEAEQRALEANARIREAQEEAEAARRGAGRSIADEPAFWIVLTSGLALAAGGVVLGVVLSAPQSERQIGDNGVVISTLTGAF